MSMNKIWTNICAWVNGEKTVFGPVGFEKEPKKNKGALARWIDGDMPDPVNDAAEISDESKPKSPLGEWIGQGSDPANAQADAAEAPEKKKHHEKDLPERLNDWIAQDEMKVYNKFSSYLSVVLAFIIILCMLMTVSSLPSFGDPSNPANNEVSRKYIEDSMKDTGAVNIVAGMILDYRAFDTFGESTVLFIAVGAVLILLRNDRLKKGKNADDAMYEPKPDIILQTISKVLIPMALMFGVYVVLNGHLSPGGGFSGGTVIGAALILYCNAFGSAAVQRFFTYKTFNTITVCALGFYAIAKSYSFYTGANHIHSIIGTGVPGDIISAGLILPLNIAVGVVVACTMFGFYSLFNKEAI